MVQPLERATAKDHGPVCSLDVKVSVPSFDRKEGDIYVLKLSNLSYGKMHLFSRLEIMRTIQCEIFNAIYGKNREKKISFWSFCWKLKPKGYFLLTKVKYKSL